MSDLKELFRELIGGRTYTAITAGTTVLVGEGETTDSWVFASESDARTACHLAAWAYRKAWTMKIDCQKQDWSAVMMMRLMELFDVFGKASRELVKHEHPAVQGAQNAMLIGFLRRYVEYLQGTLKGAPEEVKKRYVRIEQQIYDKTVVSSGFAQPGMHKVIKE